MSQPTRIEKTLTINKSAAELYQFWHNFENLPHFMKHLKSVQVYDDKRSHWVSNGVLDKAVEWDATITEDRENELIAWASAPGADVNNSGFIRFRPAPHDRGTEITVATEYIPPAGVIGNVVAKLAGEAPEQQIGDDLRRFKMLMETGEIATTEGQSQGQS